MKKDRGFTLIELMTVVIVIAVLAAIAIPSYLNQTRKARRNAAGAAMQQIALGQERFRADCTTYATGFGFACPAGAPPTFPALSTFYTSTHYTITITAGSTDGTRYQIVATPAGTQARDTCGTLTWDFGVTTAGVVTKQPANCWSN